MSDKYDDTDKGSLFKNDKKEKDSQPDYKGSLNVGGTDYWLAAWLKTGKSGKYMSLAVTAKDERKPAATKTANFDDDDLPPF